MKIKRLLASLLAVVAVACACNAQTAAEVNATQKRMLAASTPCNQGAEPFKQFIVKFNTDSAFMASRIDVTPAERSQYASILVPGNFEAKAPFAKDGDEFYQSWGELQRNKAYLECGWVDSYCTHTFEFVRRAEKWYLGKVVPGE